MVPISWIRLQGLAGWRLVCELGTGKQVAVSADWTQDVDGLGWGSCRRDPGCRWAWMGGETQSCEAQAASHGCAALSCFRAKLQGFPMMTSACWGRGYVFQGNKLRPFVKPRKLIGLVVYTRKINIFVLSFSAHQN